MARKVEETAEVLVKIYGDHFKNDFIECYKISWLQLRMISGVQSLDNDYIAALNMFLIKDGYAIVPFDDFFVMVSESDFSNDRQVPDRIIEKYLESLNGKPGLDNEFDNVELDD